MIQVMVALLAGGLFGAGLAISGMVQPKLMLAFLDVTGLWNPSVGITLFAALCVAMPAFAVARREPEPLLGSQFNFPSRKRIDLRLILGAIMFGVGWGMVGYTPATAVAALAFAAEQPVTFFGCMFLGMMAYRFTLGSPGGLGLRTAYYAPPEVEEDVEWSASET